MTGLVGATCEDSDNCYIEDFSPSSRDSENKKKAIPHNNLVSDGPQEESEGRTRGIVGVETDPVGEVRAQFYGKAYQELRDLEPKNPMLEQIRSKEWEPNAADLRQINREVANARNRVQQRSDAVAYIKTRPEQMNRINEAFGSGESGARAAILSNRNRPEGVSDRGLNAYRTIISARTGGVGERSVWTLREQLLSRWLGE